VSETVSAQRVPEFTGGPYHCTFGIVECTAPANAVKHCQCCKNPHPTRK